MNQEPPIPFSKEPIFVEWRRPDIGGIRIAAWTDDHGLPYIGLFNLNREGKPTGMPCWYERRRFLSFVVVGFDDKGLPVKVFLDVQVTFRGVQALLHLPWEPAQDFFYHRRLKAHWDSEAPGFGFIANPSNDDGERASAVMS